MPAGLKIALTIIFAVCCAVMIIIVMLQEGKDQGLGALAGANSDTYWGRNKGRSAEGRKIKATRVLAVLFVALAIILNIN